MAKHTSISLEEHLADFVDAQVEKGSFQSASDVVNAALQLLEEREVKLEALRAALIDGENSGPAEPFDVNEFLNEMHSRT